MYGADRRWSLDCNADVRWSFHVLELYVRVIANSNSDCNCMSQLDEDVGRL